MNSKVAIIVGGILIGLLILVGGGIAVALIAQDDTDDVTQIPAPVTTVDPAPLETEDPLQDILDEVWYSMTQKERDDLCMYYAIDPDSAWEAFDQGAEGLLPRDSFETFFSENC